MCVGTRRFTKICGIAIGVAIDLVAHLLHGFLRPDLLRRLCRAHKRQNALHVGAALDVNEVHTVAAGAVGRKFMLGQKGFEILGKVGAARQKFEIVFFLWVGHSAATEEGRADVGADAGLAADQLGVDL